MPLPPVDRFPTGSPSLSAAEKIEKDTKPLLAEAINGAEQQEQISHYQRRNGTREDLEMGLGGCFVSEKHDNPERICVKEESGAERDQENYPKNRPGRTGFFCCMILR